jgi:hypothetical protein
VLRDSVLRTIGKAIANVKFFVAKHPRSGGGTQQATDNMAAAILDYTGDLQGKIQSRHERGDPITPMLPFQKAQGHAVDDDLMSRLLLKDLEAKSVHIHSGQPAPASPHGDDDGKELTSLEAAVGSFSGKDHQGRGVASPMTSPMTDDSGQAERRWRFGPCSRACWC